MARERAEPKKHFVLKHTARPERFSRGTRGGGGQGIPDRDRQTHGRGLLRQIKDLKPVLEEVRNEQEKAGLEDGFGLQIEFESFPDIELVFESLAVERSGIELLNVKHKGDKTLASVFVPDGKLHVFEDKIRAYLDESRDNINEEKGTQTPKNQKLLNAIHSIRAASLESLWTDARELPSNPKETFWWEIWLWVSDDGNRATESFTQLAEGLGFRIAKGRIDFPERTVLLAYGSLEQMRQSIRVLNRIAELRRAKETADFFDSLHPQEQRDWAKELLQRMSVPHEGEPVPHVCLLDTGVNAGHPLLAPAIAPSDTHSVEPGWGVHDGEGHGTEMAGLALLGNLTHALDSFSPIEVPHRLESVKLLERNHSNRDDPQHHAYLTIQAVSRPEITAPRRQRVFGVMTTTDARDRGRPSAWSAGIDRLAADHENQGETPRLFVLAAGNIQDPNAWAEYPDANGKNGIQDPGQAWNALTVGASTELIHITESDAGDYQPIAPAGGLSPFSTTSEIWESHWPLKPDVVFEGGNAAITYLHDNPYAETKASLSLLTTCAEMNRRLFTTTNATSAATALAARMTARLMAEYPELRMETIRGLIVHSADWTQAMCKQFLPNLSKPNKGDVARLIRHCGFGQPDLSRALWSIENSLTLICEDRLQPFMRKGTNPPKLRDMNLHRLPWPSEELEALGATEVEMRVTLSYFIEPNPSARGVKSRYRYESHGLRFDVKRPHESDNEFRRRINKIAGNAEEGDGKDPNWIVGPQNRHKGSLHSDIWKGSAADLASRGLLAVFPIGGWWKTRPKLKRYDQDADYTLIVSIRAPEVDVDLYTAIENQVAIRIEV